MSDVEMLIYFWPVICTRHTSTAQDAVPSEVVDQKKEVIAPALALELYLGSTSASHE